ncbi:hypothetical protein F7D13_00105 [Methylocystis rosea]|uniref:Uncharacterized protein n=1 Tax=Methylocystis rosea TaxID=173366 RepID=A0ABX6ECR8_9HYPH|nr:hypothetical protein [Methylocystis rosea]QGM92555.1 hypothetical protein F7D13_00105 [Methylocystis rosea]
MSPQMPVQRAVELNSTTEVAFAFIQLLLPLLGERQRYHAQFKKVYAEFEDWDCLSYGFEGVRAQDILPLLVKTFSPRKFLAGGGIVDLFIERGFGFGFNIADDEDCKLLKFICQLNDALLDSGQITPTFMLAHFYCEEGEEIFPGPICRREHS